MQKSLSDHIVEVIGADAMNRIAAQVRVVCSQRDFLTAVYVGGQLVLTDDPASAYREVVEAMLDVEWFEQLHHATSEPTVPEDTVELDRRIGVADEMKARLVELETEASKLREFLSS